MPTASPRQSSDAFQPRDATEEEIKLLPHAVDRVPFAAWAVILAGAAERFTYFGVIAPWQNYMQNERDSARVPGALGLGQATAVNLYNVFFLFSYVTPMGFAVVSDTWLGRYKTLMLGLMLYLVGCIVLVTTSLPVAQDAGAAVPGFGVSLFFIGLGAASIKATYFPFLGDQYSQGKPRLEQKRNGDLVVVDGPRTLQFMYNAYYWFTNVASLSSIPVTFLEVHYDFWVAYLLCACAMCVSIVLFLLWSPQFVKISPEGNVLPKASKVLVCAAKSGFKLDRAKPAYQQAHKQVTVSWDDHFVDQINRGLIATRVIFSLLVFYLCISQMYNNLVSQAGQMDLVGVPNDMIQAFSGVACIVFGPLIQALYEFLAKKKIEFGPVLRITVSFVFCGGSMAYAAGLQKLIYSTGPCYDEPSECAGSQGGIIPNDVNIWAQLPVYVLLAVAEIFGFVTAFEYAYNKAPKDMKSVVQAMTQLTAGLASLLGMAVSPAAEDPKMVVFYACLASAMGLSAFLFWFVFRKYDDMDGELNRLDHKVNAAAEASPTAESEDIENAASEKRK